MNKNLKPEDKFLRCYCGNSIQRGARVINGHQQVVISGSNTFECIGCGKKYSDVGELIHRRL